MKEVIEKYKDVVIQIGTPYSVGTGFFLKRHGVIVTNDHVVRENKTVTIDGKGIDKQLTRVLYSDPNYDLAFLEVSNEVRGKLMAVELFEGEEINQGESVVAVGHPFGYEYAATQGIVSNPRHLKGEIEYLQHDAALNPGNSGGPLVDEQGRVIGVNTFIIQDGNSVGFSLHVKYLKNAIDEFSKSKDKTGGRCATCLNVIFEDQVQGKYCPHCGSEVLLPSMCEEYEASGIARTIENFITRIGHDVRLSRMGPNQWNIKEGSASIHISYNHNEGLIYGDAYLCKLPKTNIAPIYEFILKQNYEIEGLSLSVPGNSQDVVLSLFIYDRYLDERTGSELFRKLFLKADELDNILIEQYGALPKEE